MLSAIVLAAGKGKRFISKVPKVISSLGGKPVIWFSLATLNRHPEVNEIIVVTSPKNKKRIAEIIRKYKINKVCKIVPGGEERRDSVLNGLRSIRRDTDYVLIHDGARPFIDAGMVSRLCLAAKKAGASIAAVKVKNTIKEARKRVVARTLRRDNLWEAQTPQVFRKEIILKAYARVGSLEATDDAMLVERMGVAVGITPGSYSNIKITTPEDLIAAGMILKKAGPI
ncbi:MAG: 2-C-methyl-D-erythritol 4-phosphate cytidylyltransferase [Candidatus Omnitrophota bacterium]|jgi:2-C-methyl-D-erythritol 4-phosphate cytidylyltransferase